MAITKNVKQYYEKMSPEYISDLLRTDPESIGRSDNFASDEVVNYLNATLDDRTRSMVILATLLDCQGIDEFQAIVSTALDFGVTSIETREIVCQAVTYLEVGRVLSFLKAINKILEEKGVTLPLEGQATITTDNRHEAGIQAQVDIFGEGMRGFWQSGAKEGTHINYWLADNCFGDYYVRKGLDYKQHELIAFCFLTAQGGVEPQLTSYATANMKIGSDKAFLTAVTSNALPSIGYSHSLNALRCVNEAADKLK